MAGHLDRDETISIIRAELRRRSGKAWSVTGGRGTGWGWITITAPPRRRYTTGRMSSEDADELGALLGLRHRASLQGVNIPDSNDYYAEYTARAKGETPAVVGTPYWD